MKTASVGLAAHLDGEVTTLVACVKLILTKYQPRIINITQANPGVVTTRWAHGLMTGDLVKLVKVRGMIEVNRQEYQVTVIDSVRYSIDANTTGFTTYTHKGISQKVIGYTEHSTDLVFEKLIYKSTLGYTPDSIKQALDMAVDTIEHRGILTNAAKNEIAGLLLDGITDEDLTAGRYDNAQVEIFLLNYEDLSQGRMNLPISGNLGETALHRGTYQAELSGKTAKLQEVHQKNYTAHCRADLGDDYDGSEPEHKHHPGFGCKVRLDPPFWQADTAYTVRPAGDAGLGSVVKPSAYSGLYFEATVAGTSGLSEPAWNTEIGGTTADGSVTWITVEAFTKEGSVTTAIDQRRFIDANRSEAPIEGIGGVSTLFPITAVNTGLKRFTITGNHAAEFPANNRFTVVGSPGNDGTYTIVSATDSGPDTLIIVTTTPASGSAGGSIVGRLPTLVGFFTFGLVTFLDGKNIGIAREVRSFSVSTTDGETFTGPGLFEFFEAFPFPIETGDRYEATAGCDKSLVMCVQKFDNINNRRSEDNVPGNDSMLQYPDLSG